MNDSHSPIRLLHKMRAPEASSAPTRPVLRRASRLMPLEQRFMFDAAAVTTAAEAAHVKPDAVHVLVADVVAPAQIKEADPARDNGRKEVVFIDTSIAGYKTLEAGVPDGFAIVEIDSSRDGLAQMAKWAETHAGYDAIHILSHAVEGKLELGTTLLSDSSLSNSQVQAEWAAVGHALNAGGDLMVYGCDLAKGTDGDLFIHDLAAASGADVAASTDLTGTASKGGNWILEKQVGDIEARAISVDGFDNTLGNVVTGNDPGASYTNTNTISPSAPVDLAQSFTATKTGLLTTLTLYGNFTSGTATLNVYSGDGTGGALLETQSLSPFNVAATSDTGNNRYIGTNITLSTPVNITNGNVYTFQITTNDGISLTYTNNTDYAGGTLYDTGIDQTSQFDLMFSVTQADANSAPNNTVAPAISGTQTVGNALSATTGTWSDADGDTVTYSYQWYRADDSSGTNATAIGSATSSSYTLTTSDAHKYMRVVVTANDGNGHTPTANSAWTAVNDSAPSNSVVPALSGTTTVGSALTTTTGTWSDADVDTITYSYQWYRADDSSGTNATAIGSATSSSYTLTSSDGNHYVRAVVTANDSHGSSNQTAASAWTSIHTVPSVSSIVRTGGASSTVNTGDSSVQYTVTFSESVTGVDATDFALTMTGTSFGSIASVSGSGTTYTVTVDTLSGDGILRLDLNSSGTGIKSGNNVDIAGGYSSGSTYTLDHTAPNAPSTPDMTSGTDTGSSNSDNITINTTPTFTGTAESGSTVTLYDTDGTTVLGTGTATGGNWSITSSALSSGSHTVTAKATDAAANVSSASSGLSVDIDAAAPTGLGLSATTIATQNTTSTSTIATLSSTDSHAITYSLAAGNGTNDADNGSFTISGTSLKVGASSLTAGTYKIYVAATDTAGNVTNQAFTITIVDAPSVSSIVRTGGASATVSGAASSVSYTVTFSESVTGVDATDFALTSTGTASGNIASVSGSGATYTVTVDTLSGDGTLRLDLNGSGTGIQNGSSIDIASGYASGSTYTLDHTAPNAPSTPDMTSGTDSGSSNSDNITSNTTPTFIGTAESGSTVTLYDTDGTTVLGTATATGGNWSITSSALSSGSHTLTAKSADAAGNVSSASSGLSVDIDAAAPTGLGLSATTIATQNTTSTSTIATLSSTDSHAVTYSLAAGNGTNDADNGSFTISGNSLKVGASSLTAGTYKIYVAATDTAGNVANQAFTITIVDAPSVSSIVRTGGASATVNGAASSVSYTVTFSESVTGVDATDFALTSTGTASGNIASVSGSGATYTVTVDTLSGDGTLRLDLNGSGTGIQNGSSIDIASGYASGSTYTLDHTAPNAPSTPDMTSGTDTGSSNSDNITGNTTPTFTGTAESGSTVTLYDTDGTTVLGTGTATGGNWSITSSALSDGSHTVTAKAADAAGNVSSASSGLSVAIDATASTVSSVSVPSNGSYKAGQTLSFTVNTDEAVTVDTTGGTPRIALTVGSSTVYADYVSGSGSSALVFAYTVQAGDTDADGITVGALQSNGGTLKDVAGNSMTLTLNSVGSTSNVLVDTTAPTVDSVSVPSNGTYYTGQNLDFTVNFSEVVTADTSGGTPRIALTLDTGGTVYADYVSGSGTAALAFRYTVANGTMDQTGITIGSLQGNGGTLKDAAGNDATLTLNSVGSTAAVNVDGSQPQVTDVSSTTANGSYNAGDTVSVTVTFDRAVTVDTTGGTPTLALGDGGVATYSTGSGTSTLVFTYTVSGTENSADLDYASTGALALNGGAIRDSGGSNVNALLTLASPGAANSLGANKDIVIDNTPPSITFSGLALSNDAGSSSTDFITNAASQTITATLSGAPAAGDVVYGSLDNGATWADITGKVSGATLTWDNVTLTASSTLKLKVTDSAGNDGTIKSQAYTFDSAVPAAPSTPDMTSGTDTGSSSSDNVTSNTAPIFTGTAESGSTVTLYDTDGTTVLGTGTATGGNWSITSSALSDGSHTITAKATDAAGNVSSASSGLSVAIDSAAPTISSVSVPADGSYKVGQPLSFTVNADEAVTVDTAGGTPRIALTVGGSTVYADYASGSGSSALVFTYAVQVGDADADGIVVGALQSNGGTLKDAAGNDMTLALNNVGSTAAVNVDGSRSQVTDVSATTANGSYGAGSAISVTVTFDRAVTVDTTGGTPTLALGDGGVATYSSGSGTSTLVFTYNVSAGQNSADLDYASTGALALNGGTIRDSSGSHLDALLALASPGSAGSLGANKAIVIDTTPPSITFTNLAFSNDNGASNSDFVTSVASQTITATLSGAPAVGDVVYGSLDNGAHWTDITGKVSGATLTWDNVTLTASSTLKLKVTDSVGNDGTVKNQAYVLATGSPSTLFGNLALSDDTGVSHTDFITRTANQTVSATLSAPLSAGEAAYGSLDGGATWVDITGKISGTTLHWDSVTLSGSGTMKFKVVDAFGHDGPVASQAYVLDTVAPDAPTVATIDTSSTTPILTGTASLGTDESLAVTVNGATYHVVPNGRSWSLDLASASPATGSLSLAAGGSYTVQAAVSDAAGNTRDASGTLTITVPPPLVADTAGMRTALIQQEGNSLFSNLVPGSGTSSVPSSPTISFLSSTTESILPNGVGRNDSFDAGNAASHHFDGIVLDRGIADQTVAGTETTEISIPANTFAYNPDATIALTARLANGSPLPSWISFDAAEGKFTVHPPQGMKGEIAIKLVARDSRGHEAATTFKIKVGGNAQKHAALGLHGRPALSEQVRQAANDASSRMNKLAHVAEWLNS